MTDEEKEMLISENLNGYVQINLSHHIFFFQ